jgi:hypothetical protein
MCLHMLRVKMNVYLVQWSNRVNYSLYKISGLVNLKGLQISCSKVTDVGIIFLKGTLFSN